MIIIPFDKYCAEEFLDLCACLFSDIHAQYQTRLVVRTIYNFESFHNQIYFARYVRCERQMQSPFVLNHKANLY